MAFGLQRSVQLVSKISNLCDPDSLTLQTDRQTDRRTTCDHKTVLYIIYSASCGKNVRCSQSRLSSFNLISKHMTK